MAGRRLASSSRRAHLFAEEILSRSRDTIKHQRMVRLGDRGLNLGVSRRDQLGTLIADAFIPDVGASPWAELSISRRDDIPVLPSLEWAQEWILRGQEIPQSITYPYRIFFDRIVGLLYVLDQSTRHASVWIRHDQEIDLRSFITPFRLMISWLANMDNAELVHASCAVINGQGVVFAGGPGVGKSTISLAAGIEGYRVISDDSVIIQNHVVHAVYSRAKVTEESRELLGLDARSVTHLPAHARAKGFVTLADLAGFQKRAPLTALCFPVLNPRTGHYQLTPRAAYQLLATHSLPEVLGGGPRNVLRLARTAQGVPAWRALFGTNMAINLAQVEDALDEYKQASRGVLP
jgi:hypothetical protein